MKPSDNTVPSNRDPSPSILPRPNNDIAHAGRGDVGPEFDELHAKFLDAINTIATFDVQLGSAQRDLSDARAYIKQVEAELKAMAAEKEMAEQAQIRIEKETVELTETLFTEANTMVADERRTFTEAIRNIKSESDKIQHQNDRLVANLHNRERKLLSELQESKDMQEYHQLQLQELKGVLAQMEQERKNQKGPPDSNPSKLNDQDERLVPQDTENPSPNNYSHGSLQATIIPDHTPLDFTDVLEPIFRTDLVGYAELQQLLRTSEQTVSELGENITGVSSQNSATTTSPRYSMAPMSLITGGSRPVSLSLLGNAPPPPPISGVSNPALQVLRVRESPLYQRLLVEDLEPCLRLDQAPGVGIFALSRRSVMAALLAGTLCIEPLSHSTLESLSMSTSSSFSRQSFPPISKRGGFGGLFGFKRQNLTPSSIITPSEDVNAVSSLGSSIRDRSTASQARTSVHAQDPILSQPSSPVGRPTSSRSFGIFNGASSTTSPAANSESVSSSFPASTNPPLDPVTCTLCVRKGTVDHPHQGTPTHFMRIGEPDSIGLNSTSDQKCFPLCDWCVGRLRACVELVAFLRLVAAGMWRSPNALEIGGLSHSHLSDLSAWRELTRLRDRLFWRRIGAGVQKVPTEPVRHSHSGHSSMSSPPQSPPLIPHISPSTTMPNDFSPPSADGRPESDPEEVIPSSVKPQPPPEFVQTRPLDAPKPSDANRLTHIDPLLPSAQLPLTHGRTSVAQAVSAIHRHVASMASPTDSL